MLRKSRTFDPLLEIWQQTLDIILNGLVFGLRQQKIDKHKGRHAEKTKGFEGNNLRKSKKIMKFVNKFLVLLPQWCQ